MFCGTAVPKKSEPAAEQRRAAAASKLLNVQERRTVAFATRICPRSGEFVTVSDPCIRLEVAPDFRPKLSCKRLFRRSHLSVWGWRERASRRKNGNESEETEGARHRSESYLDECPLSTLSGRSAFDPKQAISEFNSRPRSNRPQSGSQWQSLLPTSW